MWARDSLRGTLTVRLVAAFALIGIVAGAIAFRFVVGYIEMAPTRLSKANTFLEFGVLALVMAQAAGLLDASPWLMPLFIALFASVLVSGAHYVWVWRRKAIEEERRG